MHQTENHDLNIIFSIPGQQQAGQFTGVSWVRAIVPPVPASRKVNINVFAEQGTNVSWHAHPCQQMLIAMDGTGYYQEKGQALQMLGPGEMVFIKPGVEHWHAASDGSDFKHVVISANASKQIVTWLKRVKN